MPYVTEPGAVVRRKAGSIIVTLDVGTDADTDTDGRLERLAERAYAEHLDWAIELAFRMADPIMQEGRSGHYEAAAGWLAIAARAHAASGRAGAWATRLESLIETHRRKYKLRPLLEALRYAAC